MHDGARSHAGASTERGRSLATTMTIALVATVALFVLVLHFLSVRVVRRGFEELEAGYARTNVERVMQAIAGRVNDLATSAADWASWDDTYRFAQDANEAYVASNLVPDALVTLRIDALMIFDSASRLVWGGVLDRNTSTLLQPSAGLVGCVERDVLRRLEAEENSLAGLVAVEGMPMLIASHRILTSLREGPPVGVLVMGKLLDASAVEEIAGALRLDVEIVPVRDAPEEIVVRCQAADSLDEAPPVRVIDRATIAGYALVRALDKAPVSLLRVRMERDIAAQGHRTERLFRRVLVGAALCLILAVGVAVRRLVGNRLLRLGDAIGRISDRGDFSTRVPVEGSDELSLVARAVNGLLDRVVASRGALEASEERFRRIASSVADWIWELDAGGTFTYASPAVKRILGFEPEEVVGKRRFWDLFVPERREALREGAVRAMARKEPFTRLAHPCLHKDGHVVILESTGVPVLDQDGTLIAYCGAHTDITDRVKAEEETRRLLAQNERAHRALLSVVEDHRRAERALRESERLFSALATMAPIGIFRTDAAGATVYVNPRWSAISGLAGHEAMGDGWLRAVHPDDRDAVACGWRRAADEATESTAEYRFMRPDGTIAWVFGQAVPEFDGEGNLIGYVGAIMDITERKSTEDALRRLLVEKEALLREVHHRVKNNLQAVIFLIERRLDEITDERAASLLTGLQEQARAMSSVYEQVFESGDLSHVRMQDYLERLCTHVIRAFGDEGISPAVHAGDVSLEVSLAIPCGLIVNELVTNSAKYAFPVREGRACRIDVALAREGDEYVLTVRDNGVGMPPFVEAESAGTGGLRLVRLWATHQLGGTIELEPEAGTAVTIRFKG